MILCGGNKTTFTLRPDELQLQNYYDTTELGDRSSLSLMQTQSKRVVANFSGKKLTEAKKLYNK